MPRAPVSPGSIAPGALAFFFAAFWLPLPVDLALIGLTLGAAAALVLAPENPRSPWPWPDLLVLAAAAALALSIARSAAPGLSLLLCTPFVPALLIYLLSARFLPGPRAPRLVLLGLTLGTAGLAATVLAAALLAPAPPVALVARLDLPVLVVPNDILVLAVALPLVLATGLGGGTAVGALFAAASVVLSLLAMTVLNSRSALLAALLGAGVVLVFRYGRRAWLMLAGAAAGLVAWDGLRGFPLLAKFAQTPLCEPRLPLWGAAWRLWLERPWFGWGAHSFRELYRDRIAALGLPDCALGDGLIAPWPHNLVLELLSSQGLAGALAFGALFAWGLRRALGTARRAGAADRLTAVGLLGAFAAFGLAALVESSFLRYWVVVLSALLIGLAATLAPAHEPPTEEPPAHEPPDGART